MFYVNTDIIRLLCLLCIIKVTCFVEYTLVTLTLVIWFKNALLVFIKSAQETNKFYQCTYWGSDVAYEIQLLD